MEFSVVPTSEEHIHGFHAAVDAVARERRYLAFLQAPSVEQCAEFVRDNIKLDMPQFVALASGQVVGWCDVTPIPRPVHAHCGLLGMGVIAGFRGFRIGTALIRTTLERARAKGILRVELTVRERNLAAIAPYEKMGFVREGLKRNAVQVDGAFEHVLCMAMLVDAG